MWTVVLVLLALFAGKENTLNNSTLEAHTFTLAEQGYAYYKENYAIDNPRIVVIDYSKPSSDKRLYVVDTETDSVLLETYVAHGKNSGGLYVDSFSNQLNSNQSSLGFFRISEQYVGKHGKSYRLDGLEEGFNHNARKRAIVIHAAWYVNEEIIKTQGRLGRSFGCPALSKDIYGQFQELITSNTLLFVYYPDEKYLTLSPVFAG